MVGDAAGNAWLAAVVRLAVARPRSVVVFWFGFVALASLGVARIEIDTSTNNLLARSDPEWGVYQRGLTNFGGDEFIVVAFEAERAFDPAAFRDVVSLTREFERIPGVRRVDSLATVPVIRSGSEGDLLLDSPLARGWPADDAAWSEYLGWLARDRLAPKSLISVDGRVFALNLMLDEDVAGDRATIVAAVRRTLGEREVWLTGVPIFRTEVNSHTREQILLFVPLTLALVSLVIALAIRGAQAVLIALVVGATGSAAGLGAMGVLGVTLSLSTTVLPSVLLALGCAYSMHVLTVAHEKRDEVTLVEAVSSVAQPIALSGLTTVIGFLAMATVRIDSIRELATFGAIGVFVSTWAVLTLAPAILALHPLSARGTPVDSWIRFSLRPRLTAFLLAHRRKIAATWLVGLVVIGLGLGRLEIATDIILWFPRGSDVRESYEAVRARVSGITPVNVLIEPVAGAPGEADVTKPAVVDAIDRLSSMLAARDDVGRTLSLADPLRQLNGVVLEREAGLPRDADVIAQYLVLLEGVDRMRDLLRTDHTSANVLLRVDDNTSTDIVALGEHVSDWWRENGVPGFGVVTTGIMYEFGRAEEEIARGQIRGLLLAFAAIGVILLLVFRDVGVAALGLLVNLVPIGIVFGAMGLLGIRLDAATACVGSMALGIGVDDTLHLLNAYARERAEGRKSSEALDGALRQVLPALLFTTISIGCGFAALLASDFTLVRNLGAVTVAAVTLCLVADITLLPSLLLGAGSAPGRGAERADALGPAASG